MPNSGRTYRMSDISIPALKRIVRILAATLLVLAVLFVGFYYLDRYLHLEDQSPLERDIKSLESAVRKDPQNIDVRVALAQFYLESEMYSQALEQARQVLIVYPNNEGALLVSGLANAHLDRPEAALVALGDFVDIRKGHPMAQADLLLETAYYFMGDSLMRLGQPRDAIQVLEAAVEISYSDADALYLLGLAHQAEGEHEQALVHYHEAVRFVPKFSEAYGAMIEGYAALDQAEYVTYATGMQAYSLGDYSEAQKLLETATNALPDFAPAFLGLGLVCEKLGDLDPALAALQVAMEQEPADVAARQAFSRVQSALATKD